MPGRTKRRDPIELQVELVLSPGVFIRDRASYSFVSSLEGVAAGIETLINSDAARAAVLHESGNHRTIGGGDLLVAQTVQQRDGMEGRSGNADCPIVPQVELKNPVCGPSSWKTLANVQYDIVSARPRNPGWSAR